MHQIKVVAQRGDDPSVEVDYEMAENLNELAQQFGEEIVFNHAKRSIVIALQGHMRIQMDKGKEAGKAQSDIVQIVTDAARSWKPSQKRAARTTEEKASDLLNRMSPAERQNFLKEYRARAKEQAAA